MALLVKRNVRCARQGLMVSSHFYRPTRGMEEQPPGLQQNYQQPAKYL